MQGESVGSNTSILRQSYAVHLFKDGIMRGVNGEEALLVQKWK